MKTFQKLHQRSGATFILALMLLLIASMVSVVVVTASTTALRRTRSEGKTTQNMLLLQSGAKYIRDSLEGATFQRTQVTTTEAVSPPAWEVPGITQPDALQAWVLSFLKDTDGTFASGEVRSNSLTVKNDQLAQTLRLTLGYAEGKYLVFHLENGSEPEDADHEKQELYLTFFLEVQQLPTVGEETSTKTSYTLLSQKIEAYRKEALNEEAAFPFG